MKQDHEAVRILVSDIGYTEASRRTGIKRDTLYKWGQRYGWREPIKHAQSALVQTVQSPAIAHSEAMAELKGQTKLSLAKYSARAAKDSEQLSVRESPLVHKVAQVASLVWPEETGDRGLLSVAVLVQNNVSKSAVSE